MERTIDAIIFTGAGKVSHGQFALASPGDNEVVVKTHYTLVSSGTELRVLGGHYGASDNYPLIPGYSVVGEIVEIGAKVTGWRVGDLVTSGMPKTVDGITRYWGGQASHHLYDATGEFCPVLLPPGANTLNYVIVEVAAISWRGAVMAQPCGGENAVVIGLGLIGAFSTAALQSFGCRVIVVDKSPMRLKRAANLGAVPIMAGETARARVDILCPEGAEIVVEASGSTPGVQFAYSLIRPRPAARAISDFPRLLLQANYIEDVTGNPHGFFRGEGVQLITPHDRRVRDRQETVENIRTGKIPAAAFIDNVISYKEASEAYKRLRDDPDSCFSLVFDWTES